MAKEKRKIFTRRRVFTGLLVIIVAAMGITRLMPEETKAAIHMESLSAIVNETTDTTTDVALIQSNKRYASEITEEEVRDMVREAVTLAGGLEDIVKDGDTVVLKPNFIAVNHQTGGIFDMIGTMRDEEKHQPDRMLPQEVNGITTDYRVAKAVAEMVRGINPNGKIYIMESSNSYRTDEKMEILGYTKENIPYIDEFISMDYVGAGYDENGSSELVAIDLGEYKRYDFTESLIHTGGIYYIDKRYYEADVVIDLPVLKNHSNAAMTGAVKNVGIGTTPPQIYDDGTGMRTGIDHGWEQLANFIHDFYIVKPVDFVVTDGLQGGAYGPIGSGAESYEDVKMNMRLVLAGKDPIAVDTIHSLIVGINPQEVAHLTKLADDNIGIMDISAINVIGNKRVDEVKKAFPFATGFPFSLITSEASSRQYEDFTPPEVQVDEVTIAESQLSGKVNSNEQLVKLEVYVEGNLIETIRDENNSYDLLINSDALISSTLVEVIAYDQFLNVSIITVK